MANMVTLADGREVSNSSPEWRAECLARHNHVQTLLRLRGVHLRHARQQYLRTVQATEGEESRRRLEAALLQAWKPVEQTQPPDGQT